jgi:hypothetical protein
MADNTDKPVIIDRRIIDEKLKDFSVLLESIEAVDNKTRILWKEIYSNAVDDRQNASILFLQLFEITTNKSSEYAVHGKTMAGFIERMAKANDQLIKLAQLVADSERPSNMDPDDIFDKINASKRH